MATKTVEKVTLQFVEQKETPGTIRFSEVLPEEGDQPIIGTLYVRKDALKKVLGDARALTVTIERF